MTSWQALWLGILQGLTEFLPISSSTHLALARRFFDLPSELLYFDLICHLGSLAAIVTALRKEILALFANRQKCFSFILALFPLVPGYVLLKPVRSYLIDESGLFLVLTAAFLFGATVIRSSFAVEETSCLKRRDMIWIGMAQTLALLPGISRSGSTICAARFLGWDWKQAMTFSFLLAVPTIAGGSFLESCLSFGKMELGMPLLSHYVIGFIASALIGFFTIRILFYKLSSLYIRILSAYCAIVGLFLTFWRL